MTRGYPDLHQHLDALEAAGLLIRVERPINKDTELHPLVRWQFRGGIEERERKAFLFTHVTDSKNKRYEIPVVVGALAASREIYRIGMGCPLDEINQTWNRAIANPIAPNVVKQAPCHELVYQGASLEGNGLDALPIPISTPGWDIAPFTTLSQYITRDPDSGVQRSEEHTSELQSRLHLVSALFPYTTLFRSRGTGRSPIRSRPTW